MTADLTSIVPLTGARFADLDGLFATGDPRWCWCMYFRARGRSWANSSAASNRGDLEALTSAADDSDGVAPGLVAYQGDEAVGWISIGPREDYERLAHSTVLKPLDDTPVWSIVCFVVGRKSRGAGVAKTLLDAGIDYARDHGATLLEAYPVEVAAGERARPSDLYRGTLSMFERAGFTVAERRPTPGGAPRPIVRRPIRPRRGRQP